VETATIESKETVCGTLSTATAVQPAKDINVINPAQNKTTDRRHFRINPAVTSSFLFTTLLPCWDAYCDFLTITKRELQGYQTNAILL